MQEVEVGSVMEKEVGKPEEPVMGSGAEKGGSNRRFRGGGEEGD